MLLKSETVDVRKITESFQSSVEATRTMRSITNFMLSTVNRCLDYTKVSHELKLPRTSTTLVYYNTLIYR